MKRMVFSSARILVGFVVFVLSFTACGGQKPNEILYKTSTQDEWETMSFEKDLISIERSLDIKDKESIYAIVLPSGVETIGDEAFKDFAALTSITLPHGLKTIGRQAFEGCRNLSEINIPETVTSIGIYAFKDCKSLPSEDGVRYADTYLVGPSLSNAYMDNYYHPETVRIKDGIRFLGTEAFYHKYLDALECSSEARSVIIPESLVSIGEGAFCRWSNLTTVTIPQNVNYIGELAFVDCTDLTTVYCKATTPPTLVNSLVFVYYHIDEYNYDTEGEWHTLRSLKTIYVPAESVDAYKNAHGWKQYSKYIVGYDFSKE